MKILICDDDSALVSMIRFKLSRENLGEIIKAADGREARKLIEQERPDLIVTDVHMPFHTGLEIIAYVRQELRLQTPIIILSAEGLEETVLQAFNLGANDFLSKPFSPAELAIRVRRLLQKL
ncbi:MAG: response regulator transcription factor [Cyclobacteriaceae bacterium]|nr:response regulator transcription factor [Cyclobacteriaceae bacterium]